MRTETYTKTIVKYNELTEEQKLKVIERQYDINVDYNWHQYIYEDAQNLLGKLGFENVEISFSGFSSQGDGASFTGAFSVPKTVKELKERIRAFKAEAPKDKLFEFGSLRFNKEEKEAETLEVFRISRSYSHSNTVSADHEGLEEFVRDYSNELYRRLENEYDYLTSRAAIEETIEANDYEFNLETLNIA